MSLRILVPLCLLSFMCGLITCNGDRPPEPPVTADELEADRIQNTEFINEGPSDWRQNIPIVGPNSSSTDHLK